MQGCSRCLKVTETGGETGDCLTAERADTAPGSPKMLRVRYQQVRNVKSGCPFNFDANGAAPIKTSHFPSDVVRMCV